MTLYHENKALSFQDFSLSAAQPRSLIDYVHCRQTPEQRCKRVLDVVGSFFLLLVVSPILIITAVLVKLSGPGPVLFCQTRNGLDGQSFTIYKFRTMVVPKAKDDDVKQAQANDPRITAIGRILRNTSIDELPQLLNVLKGDMSLVGPRPHAAQHNEYYGKLIDGYHLRHRMRPGITGLAQVSGWRGETDTLDKMVNRVKFDLVYIDNWSLWLDVKIIFMTALTVLFHKNAR